MSTGRLPATILLGALCIHCGSPDDSAAGSGGQAGSATGPSGGSNSTGTTTVAQLYQHCDYDGWAVGLSPGDYRAADLAALGATDDDASSLTVSDGFEVVLYSEDDFSGESVVVRGDLSCAVSLGFNDVMSSISVRAATGTGSGGSGGGGTGGSDGGGSGGSLGGSDDHYQACVDRINAFRATLDLPPYTRDAASEPCADAQAKSDSESDDAHGAFGDCGEWAQNECPGWGSIEETLDGCLQSMWNEGPGGGHYENMRGDYEEAFCGFYTTPEGDVWAIQNFR